MIFISIKGWCFVRTYESRPLIEAEAKVREKEKTAVRASDPASVWLLCQVERQHFALELPKFLTPAMLQFVSPSFAFAPCSCSSLSGSNTDAICFQPNCFQVVDMELNGTVKSFNPYKGWGFVHYNGEDIFLHKKNLDGFCPSKGDQVQFTKGQTEKGPVAENVKVVSPPFEETSYYGSIKSYNPWKGYGFISSKAFPDQDVFVFWSELPGGFGPEGSPCKFRVSMDEKGPAAKKVMLLGAAGNQIQQMKWMLGYGYRGFGGFGKCRWEPCKAGVCIGVG